MIFSGVVSVLFGIALLIGPLVGAVVLTWWLGAYALVFGITLLVLAFKLKSRKDDAPSYRMRASGPERERTKRGRPATPRFRIARIIPCSRSAAATTSGLTQRTASGSAARRGR